MFAREDQLRSLWGLCLSSTFDFMFKMLLGRFGFPEFIVGILEKLPVPDLGTRDGARLGDITDQGARLKRDLDTNTQTSHVFIVPVLLHTPGDSLVDSVAARQKRISEATAEMAKHQNEIDHLAYRLYDIPEEDRQSIESSLQSNTAVEGDGEISEEVDSATAQVQTDRRTLAADFISYSLGCAFGRWDVRIALDQTLAPELAGPFDPLPVCSPGMLVGPDALPAAENRIVSEEWLRARPDAITLPPPGTVKELAITATDYPLPVAWDGILVDDEGHEDDVVRRVRLVLGLLFGERAETRERDLCAALGLKQLRNYLRHPQACFADHIARYSKSRRKAPIYWLLQSDKRSYAVWLYCHRITKDTLHRVQNDYVVPK